MSTYLLAGATLGLLAHHLVFIHGEWHVSPHRVITAHVALLILLQAASLRSEGRFRASHVALVSAAYLLTLLSSIAGYRLFFHRLRRFPGPRLAALSKLWHVCKCRHSHGHHVLEQVYQQYGEFVRTGPNEVTIFHPAAFEAMDGPGNRNTRSDWYDLLLPRQSSIFTRDRRLHAVRRKMWEYALSTQSLHHLYARIRDKVKTLANLVDSQSGRPVVVNELMYWFAFDSMGDFAFSQDFGMMKTRQWLASVKGLRRAIALLGPFSPAIWIPRLGFAIIPGFWKVKDWFQMLAFCDECMQERTKKTIPSRDIASWFLEDFDKAAVKSARQPWLSGDTATLVVAGSDTTAPSLIVLFYFLAKYPEHTERIYAEIQTVDRSDPNALSTLPQLNGVINESMRLLPAVLTFSSRVTPPEGMRVDGTFIPGGVKVCAPRYTIGRLDKAWVRPHEFIPERWSSQPSLIKDKRAFAPFGLGHTSCVGRHLAMAQIRMVAANLINRHRIAFAPAAGQGEAVERDMLDQLTAQPGECLLVFTER